MCDAVLTGHLGEHLPCRAWLSHHLRGHADGPAKEKCTKKYQRDFLDKS